MSGTAHERLRTLAASAAIGTDRVGGDVHAPTTLLTDAARIGLQSRAGWRPPAVSARLPECPADDRPLAPAAALATLQRLLGGADAALIDEWFELARDRGVGIDAPTMPRVLEWSAGQPRRADVVMEVLGQRGSWLAALNPEWQARSARLPANLEEVWQTGKSGDRLTLLVALRRVDPARARQLVEATWSSDSAADREQCLERLIANRSLDDEPLLERALDDRSKIVRRKAAAVLAIVPGSALRARLTAVARTIVRSDAGARSIGGARRLRLAPPAAFDPAWARDGIEERPPAGIGPRAWWLRQIVERADLAMWHEVTGLDPESILAALEGDDYAGDVAPALAAAARLAGDDRWIAALVRDLLAGPDLDLTAIASLSAAAGDQTAGALTLETLATLPADAITRWTFLSTFDRAWPADFSRRALTLAGVAPAATNDWRLLRAVDAISRRIAPEAGPLFEETLARVFPGGLPASAVHSIERARLRADMRKEFGS